MVLTHVSGKAVLEYFKKSIKELEHEKVRLKLIIAEKAMDGGLGSNPEKEIAHIEMIDEVIDFKTI
jgi:hypothetical protein